MGNPEFTKYKGMVLPRVVLAGHDVLSRLGDICREFAFERRVMLVTGPRTGQVCGKDAERILTSVGLDVQTVECGHATVDEAERLHSGAKDVRPALIVGVGGGSKIDLAKVTAARMHVPFVSVPTSAAHDGIASPRASLQDNGMPCSEEAVMPIAVLADTAIIVRAPYRQLAAGCADVIANTTSILDWELAARLKNEPFSTSAATFAKFAAHTLIENAGAIKPGLEESVWLAIKPIITSGISMSIAGSSRPASGSEHMFAHMLERISPGRSLHGERCGIGAIMMMYLHGGEWWRIREALEKIGAPTSAKEIGMESEQVIEALVRSHTVRPERYTILGEAGLTPEAAERIATITQVI